MARGLSDDEIIEILEVYDEKAKKRPTSEETGRSRSTVKKYVEKHYDHWKETGELVGQNGESDSDDGGGDQTGDDMYPTDTQGMSAAPSPGGDDDDSREPDDDEELSIGDVFGGNRPDQGSEYAEVGYGEFIREFFDGDFGVGDKWVNKLAVYCSKTEQIPDERTLENAILDGASGIGSEWDAEMIARSYGPQSREFLEAKEQAQRGRRRGGSGWQSPDMAGGGRSGGSPMEEGNWQSARGQSRPGGQIQFPGGSGGRNGRGQNQDGHTDEEIKELRNALRQVRNTQETIAERIASDGDDSLTDSLEEVAQAKQILDQIDGGRDDEVSQIAQQFQRQIQQLETRLEEERAGGGGNNSDVDAFLQVAQRDDVDPDVLQAVAQASGISQTNPEVEKEKWKFKREERKAQNRKEMIDSAFDNLGDVMESLSQSSVQALLSSDEGEDVAEQGHAEERPAASVAEPVDDVGKSTTQERFEELQEEVGGTSAPAEPEQPQMGPPPGSAGATGGAGGGGIPEPTDEPTVELDDPVDDADMGAGDGDDQ